MPVCSMSRNKSFRQRRESCEFSVPVTRRSQVAAIDLVTLGREKYLEAYNYMHLVEHSRFTQLTVINNHLMRTV